MATSGTTNRSPPSGVRKPEEAKQEQNATPPVGEDVTEINDTPVRGNHSQAMFSYSTDVSPEFQERVEDFVTGLDSRLSAKLSRNAMGDNEHVPFTSVRTGETITVVVPLTLTRGDALAELIMLVASKTPTCVLRQGNQGWEEPQWTTETSRHLMGLVSAIQAPPESLAHGSSPVDLARVALWNVACTSALSQPGGVKDAQGSVLPTTVGGVKSASKYLTKIFASLRGVSSEEKHLSAVSTLERLLKVWIKNQYDDALNLVRKNKIAWGTVLTTGSPTQQVRKKGSVITQLKTPSKPSRSPFLSARERQLISSLYAPEWNVPDQMRIEWNRMSPQEQHSNYSDFIVRLKQHYENINKISTSVHAKLGHRKKWIHAACEQQGTAPSSKKDKSNEFVWSSNFWKLNTAEINLSVALVFAPSHYLVDPKYNSQTILDRMREHTERINSDYFTDEMCGVTVDLWKEWGMRFAPLFTITRTVIPEAITLQDDNPFAALALPDREA